jgi:DNA replication protein DnaC
LRQGQATIEDVDYRTPRRLDKALFQQLTACKWITEHRNLLVTGPCGVGKSWLACALGQKPCRDGFTVHYAREPRVFADPSLHPFRGAGDEPHPSSAVSRMSRQ